jgi:hypothetical protein
MQNNPADVDSGRLISIYFKEAWTNNTKYYKVYTGWSFGHLMNALGQLISDDFRINPELLQLVPFGQDSAENGDPIDIYGQFTATQLREYWNQESEMGFYIRKS